MSHIAHCFFHEKDVIISDLQEKMTIFLEERQLPLVSFIGILLLIIYWMFQCHCHLIHKFYAGLWFYFCFSAMKILFLAFRALECLSSLLNNLILSLGE